MCLGWWTTNPIDDAEEKDSAALDGYFPIPLILSRVEAEW